jgi:sugar lactone lactonase YvrE
MASFSPSAFELPEGLVVRNGKAYLGFAPLGRIVEIGPNGAQRTYATVPAGYADGYLTGMVFDAAGNLFVASTRNNPGATKVVPAIYKIPPTIDGGLVDHPFATDPNLVFPNGLAFDTRGTLYVTDSATGVVLAVSAEGKVSTWASGPALSGSPSCPAPLPFPMGANGIVMTPESAFVANTAKGSIVRISILPDGSAGAQTTLFEDCRYVGLDGLARATDGSLWIAQNGAPGRILRATESGDVSVVHAGAPLDGPASLAFDREGKSLLVTNAAFFSVAADGGAPAPSLLRYGPLP